jgi:hypothetical protein
MYPKLSTPYEAAFFLLVKFSQEAKFKNKKSSDFGVSNRQK